MTPKLPADAAARARIESDLDTSLLVEAAAGTGKTTQLVARLVAVLASGRTTVDRIVAVTFTRKAAGELKLRLRQALDGARAGATGEVEQRHLEDALARLEEAHIGTIHSFCAEILRERPVEAGVDPAFVELDDEDAGRIYDRAFRAWIERRLDRDPPLPGLERALARLAGQRSFDGSTPLDRLRDAGYSLVDWRDFPAPWRREMEDREAEIDGLVEAVRGAAALVRKCENRHDYLRRALEPSIDLATWIVRSEEVSGRRDHDGIEAALLQLLRDLRRNVGWKGRGRWYAPGIAREDAVAERDALIERLDTFKHRADAELAALLREELREVLHASADEPDRDGYEELKVQEGRLDFLDLLLRARDLVRGDAAVRRELQERFSHLFVDEFQDTDPLQAEILLLLAADDPTVDTWRRVRPAPGKLFLVGDPKQSIYRFRRADVVLYQEIKRDLLEMGVDLVHLTCSFRAVRPIQEMVNAAFAEQMTGDLRSGQPDYVALDPFRDAPDDQPSLIALPAPQPYGFSRITGRAIEECLPRTVAAWVEWLLEESGWTVEDPERRGTRRPVEARDVAFLFRRFMSWGQDVSRAYVRELEARGVPHLLVGGRSFHDRLEVETLRAALTAIEWPDDEMMVYAALHGTLFALDDNLLLRFREEVGGLHPFRKVPEEVGEDLRPVALALRTLADLHKGRNRRPIVDTIQLLLDATRAHAGFALRPAGGQVLINVQYICDLARRFELRGGLSFRGFVEQLTAEARRPGSGQSPVLEEGADGVRILTAHAAKGLEFPIVVLADITANLKSFEPSRTVDPAAGLCAQKLLGCSPWELLDAAELEADRDAAEGIRLAYVAATRARDILVVPTVGDEPWKNGWVSPLERAIRPPLQRYRQSEPAPSCPPFGDATVLLRPQQAGGGGEISVRPGLHRPELGRHRVVWWDPRILKLDVPGRYGVREQHILAPDDEGVAADAGWDAWTAWRTAREDALLDGAEPRLTLTTATGAETDAPLEAPRIDIESARRSGARPGGRRFGTLVHTMLRDVAYDAEPAAIDALAAYHGRQADAPPEEVEAAARAVEDALAHPLLAAAATAAREHREVPFTLRLGEVAETPPCLLEGTIDLLFHDAAGEWVVVDFKTDADLEGAADGYRRQIGWYLAAVEQLFGGPARGVLLAV